MAWTSENLLEVSNTILQDQRDNSMAANVGIMCPVCKKSCLDYDRTDLLTMVFWCNECGNGGKQGDP